MKNKKIIILILILFFFISLTNEVMANKPELSIIIIPKNKNPLPKEDIIFSIAVSGRGPVNNSKIYCITEVDFYISMSTDPNILEFVSPPSNFVAIGEKYVTDKINNVVPNRHLLESEAVDIPFLILNMKNSKERAGDHKLSCVLTYQDFNGNWYTSKTEEFFHIQTYQDRFWWIYTVILLSLTIILVILTYKLS